jgi:hypothetical protein
VLAYLEATRLWSSIRLHADEADEADEQVSSGRSALVAANRYDSGAMRNLAQRPTVGSAKSANMRSRCKRRAPDTEEIPSMDLKEQTVGEGRKQNRWHRVLEDRNRTPLRGLI